jgi:CheY-like chemotaxis protein
VYAAADRAQAAAFTSRLLPDVVVVQMDTPDTLAILMRLSEDPSTSDIPVVVLTASLYLDDARRVRAAGGVPCLPYDDADVLVGEVDTLIPVAARAQRALERRLVDLRELAGHWPPGAVGQD